MTATTMMKSPKRSFSMRVILLAAALLIALGAARPARALDYTDLWWNADESGWGVNFVQSNTFIFATFFLYDASHQPFWVSAQLTLKPADGTWTGPVYVTEGTPFDQPWNNAQSKATATGQATFTPSGTSSGKLDYTIAGVQVTKAISRQTLTAIPMNGTYATIGYVSITDCIDPTRDFPKLGVPSFVTIAQTGDSMKVEVHRNQGTRLPPELSADTLLISATGAFSQQGTLQRVPSAAMVVTLVDSTPTKYSGRISQLRRNELGLNALLSAVGEDGCQLDISFAGVAVAP